MKNKILISILALIFISAFAVMLYSSKQTSQTTDEGVHLMAGLTYLKEGDFRLDPEHPPLLKELAAVPLLFQKDLHYQLDGYWQKAGTFYYDSWQEARILGNQLFYEMGNNPEKLLFWSRLPFILLTLCLGAVAYFWARNNYGKKAGVLAAFLTLFCPTILAHGILVNTDLGLTLFFVLTVYFWGKFLKTVNWRVSWPNLVLCGLFFGLAMASKYTAAILVLIIIILAIIKIVIDKQFNFRKYIGGFVFILFSGYFVVWATYGFSVASAPHIAGTLANEVNYWSNGQVGIAPIYEQVFKQLQPIMTPSEYFKGLFLLFTHAVGGHGAYLMGMNSNTGWWYYFPVAIFFKTPIPVFVLLVISITGYKKVKAKESFDEYLLIVPIVIFLLFSMSSRANLGVRHILPIMPLLFIFIAKSVNLIDFRKINWKSIGFGLLMVWYLVTAFLAYPNYIAYFNEFAGGSSNGHKILTDSNLDWGQDIYRIQDYIEKNKIAPSYIVYPWDSDSALTYYKINYPLLTPENTSAKGHIIMSATYYETEAYSWLKQYPKTQITPGVFDIEIK